MKSKKARLSGALLLTAALVVGVAVHLLFIPPPEEARAVVQYSVYAYWLNGMQQVPINDADIEFDFLVGGIWTGYQNAQGVAAGIYAYTRDNWADDWRIRIGNQWYTGVDPWVGLLGDPAGTQNSVSWRLAFPM